MELAVGAMGSLIPKLVELLEDELVKQMGLRGDVESCCRELPMMEAALVEVSKVPPEQLSATDKLWAQRVRELSYDMEDAVDDFMLRVDDRRRRREPSNNNNNKAGDAFRKALKDIARKTKAPLKNLMDRRHISHEIKGIKDLSKELSDLRAKYAFNSAAYAAANTTTLDPRVINLHKNQGRELVGIEEARDDLLRMLLAPAAADDGPPETPPHLPLKVVSILGSGGLGKTTLAQLVHDQLNAKFSFDCCAFVSVGRKPNITSTLREILEELGQTCSQSDIKPERLCKILRQYLQDKRYNIVVDDVWEKETWEAVECALPDSNCGSKVIMTTRKFEVGAKANDVYNLKPLPHDKSKELFCARTSSKNIGDNQLVDKIIRKCDGVPLAIIAIASLLADKPLEDWQTVYDSLIVGHEDKTRKILLYSYYDLPPHLKPCMLYLSMYPEDCLIEKSPLIWRWIAEGFVQLQNEGCCSLLEVGERYFDELLNRSMILAKLDDIDSTLIAGCRVHDIVLDLIRDLSMEENFVTILGKKQLVESSASVTRGMKELGLMHGSERKVRRLSIQSNIPLDTISMPEVVRSLQTRGRGGLIEVSQLSSFRTCRVLSISRITGDLKHMGKLLHPRYLDISGRSSRFVELPKELGNLKSLQTL